MARREEIAAHQTPSVAVLCCIDSRVPPELVFDQGLGTLFVARVAGNVVDDALLHGGGVVDRRVVHRLGRAALVAVFRAFFAGRVPVLGVGGVVRRARFLSDGLPGSARLALICFEGLALASVENGTCRGCNMNIPPQLFNVLQRGNSVETCPYCHRIIYWADIMKDPSSAKPVAEAPAPKKADKKG